MVDAAKATSVRATGEPDGWVIPAGFEKVVDPHGETGLVVSVPTDRLAAVHGDLVRAVGSPLGVLYRQHVDRRTPRPEGAPPQDHVGLDLPTEQVLSAWSTHAELVYHDARAEHWVRGPQGDQVVLDRDGLLFCYPDDPRFRAVLARHGLPEVGDAEAPDVTMDCLLTRDYVKHWFHASADPHEMALLSELGLVEVAPQQG